MYDTPIASSITDERLGRMIEVARRAARRRSAMLDELESALDAGDAREVIRVANKLVGREIADDTSADED